MTTLWAMRDGMALRPWGAESAAIVSKVAFGKPIEVTVRSPRNSKHSALFWILCHRIGDAIGVDAENVSDLLKIETGHCDIIRSKKHGELRLPRSISFAKMDQQDFAAFFDKCLAVIEAEWGIARPDVRAAVSDILEDAA